MAEADRGRNRPLVSSVVVISVSLGGSGMLQSVPAHVASHVHVASLLHTCLEQTEINEAVRGEKLELFFFFFKSAYASGLF